MLRGWIALPTSPPFVNVPASSVIAPQGLKGEKTHWEKKSTHPSLSHMFEKAPLPSPLLSFVPSSDAQKKRTGREGGGVGLDWIEFLKAIGHGVIHHRGPSYLLIPTNRIIIIIVSSSLSGKLSGTIRRPSSDEYINTISHICLTVPLINS